MAMKDYKLQNYKFLTTADWAVLVLINSEARNWIVNLNLFLVYGKNRKGFPAFFKAW